MQKEEVKINIIGAGVSGLVAALVLEEKGFSPQIFEKSDRAGGRVKTDVIDGVNFDHGFQVLLENYPVAQQYLDYKALDLQRFWPGSVLFTNRQANKFGDPLRNSKLLWSTIIAKEANLSDKLKIFKLNTELKKKTIDEIFDSTEGSTLNYLQALGFSDGVIHHFFQPFFSGIFLETELATSSRMFEFVFKMFAEGHASVPKAGIGAISEQLKSKLKRTKFHFNVIVDNVGNEGLTIEGLPKVESDYTIIATEANGLVSNLRNQGINWNSCVCYYFEVKNTVIKEPLIGLIPGKQCINNIHYLNSVSQVYTNKTVLSVTVVDKKGLGDELLKNKVIDELLQFCNIEVITLLKQFEIPHALPKLTGLQYDIPASQTQLMEGIFLAGDVILNGSLNAAMLSGQRAAEAIIEKLEADLRH